jgi:type III secretory pathway component EscS
LDYAALSVVGMMIAVVAAFFAPGGAARFEDGFRQVAAAAAAAGVDAEAIRWVTKVITVGGALALSGGVAGAIILAMASVVVYAVFAKAR